MKTYTQPPTPAEQITEAERLRAEAIEAATRMLQSWQFVGAERHIKEAQRQHDRVVALKAEQAKRGPLGLPLKGNRAQLLPWFSLYQHADGTWFIGTELAQQPSVEQALIELRDALNAATGLVAVKAEEVTDELNDEARAYARRIHGVDMLTTSEHLRTAAAYCAGARRGR